MQLLKVFTTHSSNKDKDLALQDVLPLFHNQSIVLPFRFLTDQEVLQPGHGFVVPFFGFVKIFGFYHFFWFWVKNWFSGHGKPILGKTKLVPCVGGLLGASRILPALSTQLKNWFPVQSVLKTRFSEFFFGLPLRRPGFPFFSEPGPRMVLRIGFWV